MLAFRAELSAAPLKRFGSVLCLIVGHLSALN